MNIILPGENGFESRFGKGAQIVGHVVDNKPSPGYTDENGYFHPAGNDDRKKWSSFKKAEPRVQHYLNLGVTEAYIKAHITRLAKLGCDTETCWMRFEQIYQQDRLQFAAIKGKEEALIKFSLENPEVKDEAGNLIEPDKKPDIEPTIFSKIKNIFKNPGAIIPEKSMTREELMMCMHQTPIINEIIENPQASPIETTLIKISGGLFFSKDDIEYCISGKLKLKSQKKAIKLTKKQVKELEEQL